MALKVAICYEPPRSADGADMQDILDQAAFLQRHLAEFDYTFHTFPYDGSADSYAEQLKSAKPDVIWNLFESFEYSEAKQHIATRMLESFGFPVTGGSADSMQRCADKDICKRYLSSIAGEGVYTPLSYNGDNFSAGEWIIKPKSAHGSVGITPKSIVNVSSKAELDIAIVEAFNGEELFAERYIKGREFSATLLDMGEGLVVIGVAEMKFVGYPAGAYNILSYDAKWDESSHEYQKSVRSFVYPPEDMPLVDSVRQAAINVSALLELNGFVRVDFRVGDDNIPLVIDININPGLGEDAGFIAAAKRYGLSASETLNFIIKVALQ